MESSTGLSSPWIPVVLDIANITFYYTSGYSEFCDTPSPAKYSVHREAILVSWIDYKSILHRGRSNGEGRQALNAEVYRALSACSYSDTAHIST